MMLDCWKLIPLFITFGFLSCIILVNRKYHMTNQKYWPVRLVLTKSIYEQEEVSESCFLHENKAGEIFFTHFANLPLCPWALVGVHTVQRWKFANAQTQLRGTRRLCTAASLPEQARLQPLQAKPYLSSSTSALWDHNEIGGYQGFHLNP